MSSENDLASSDQVCVMHVLRRLVDRVGGV